MAQMPAPRAEIGQTTGNGIKCMPGRGGIDSGHEPNMKGHDDPNGDTLRCWIGRDAEEYLRYAKN